MKIRFFGTFLHLLLCSSTAFGLTSVVSKHYVLASGSSTWTSAQKACKKYYTDLATFYTDSDLSRINLGLYYTWVGLYRRSDGENVWIWTDGNSSKFTDNTNSSADCGAVSLNKMFSARNCATQLFFICQKGTFSPQYYFILEPKSWSQAQTYCKDNYDDLGSFENYNLNQIIINRDFPVWIGLHKDAGGSWSWTTGFSDVINWNTGEPSDNGDCVFVTSITKKMAATNCDMVSPFICISESVFLVKENKTWEEALQHCRGLTSPTGNKLLFDLLSVNPGSEQDYVMNKVKAADTEEVWTGLRFLADEWLWMNGAEMLYTDLPLCPIPGYHCGAFSKKDTGSVKARNCSDRKNFLCYSYLP